MRRAQSRDEWSSRATSSSMRLPWVGCMAVGKKPPRPVGRDGFLHCSSDLSASCLQRKSIVWRMVHGADPRVWRGRRACPSASLRSPPDNRSPSVHRGDDSVFAYRVPHTRSEEGRWLKQMRAQPTVRRACWMSTHRSHSPFHDFAWCSKVYRSRIRLADKLRVVPDRGEVKDLAAVPKSILDVVMNPPRVRRECCARVYVSWDPCHDSGRSIGQPFP